MTDNLTRPYIDTCTPDPPPPGQHPFEQVVSAHFTIDALSHDKVTLTFTDVQLDSLRDVVTTALNGLRMDVGAQMGNLATLEKSQAPAFEIAFERNRLQDTTKDLIRTTGLFGVCSFVLAQMNDGRS